METTTMGLYRVQGLEFWGGRGVGVLGVQGFGFQVLGG